MSVNGNAESVIKLKGSLSLPDAIKGKSAYEIAVMHGFKGTEEEWLASLKAIAPDDMKQMAEEAAEEAVEEAVKIISNDVKQMVEEAVEEAVKNKSNSRIGSVILLASKWVGTDPLYSQVVTVDGVTEKSQVDLTPSVEQLAIFYEKDLTFVTENEGGVVTVYAIGQKPENDYSIQVTITEVSI